MATDQKAADLAVKLDSVSKQYLVYHQKPTLVENILNIETKEKFWALKDFSVSFKRGEKIGIIGNNGSGKTTLLKIVSGISTPTRGSVQSWGKLVSLIDLDAGFHPELSGYENIFLNGLLLGMNKEEVKQKLGSIISFADIGPFIDAPFYTYSTGMRLRLGFSVCIHTNADIFLFDEAIYTGDYDFQRKISMKLKQLFLEKKVTLLVASHVIEFVQAHCKKCLWIDKGKIKYYGPTKNIVQKYRRAH